MITFEVFYPQRDIALKDKNIIKKYGSGNYPVYFYLLKYNEFGRPILRIKKFDYKKDDNFLKYNLSKFKSDIMRKEIPVLEEVKFRELVLDLPLDSDNYGNINRHCLRPSGIIVKLLKHKPKPVNCVGGRYPHISKYKLLIPEKYFKKTHKS